MIWWRSTLSPDVRSLLECERTIAVLPAAARSRALSRARAALAAGVATHPIATRAPSAVRWAAALGLACLATVAAGAGAYTLGVRARMRAPLVAAPRTESRAPARAHEGSAVDEPNEPILDLLAAELLAAPGVGSEAGALRAELRLVEQARSAVAREDFVVAMRLLAEHARRFRTGRLVEEREALRVRSLVGLGRRSDARRAAADFETTFPRSPLRTAVSQVLSSATTQE